MSSTVAVTVEFDLGQLEGYTDSYLALLWHVCQANPAEFGDRAACEAAEMLKLEIVRRRLKVAPVELHNHQGRHVELQERPFERLARRRAEAERLVDGASDMQATDMALLGWSLVLADVNLKEAIAEVMDALGDAERQVEVTKSCTGYYVWTRLRGVA